MRWGWSLMQSRGLLMPSLLFAIAMLLMSAMLVYAVPSSTDLVVSDLFINPDGYLRYHSACAQGMGCNAFTLDLTLTNQGDTVIKPITITFSIPELELSTTTTIREVLSFSRPATVQTHIDLPNDVDSGMLTLIVDVGYALSDGSQHSQTYRFKRYVTHSLSISCADPDGDDPLIASSTIVEVDPTFRQVFADTCCTDCLEEEDTFGDNLKEYLCEGDIVTWKIHACRGGCESGSCLAGEDDPVPEIIDEVTPWYTRLLLWFSGLF